MAVGLWMAIVWPSVSLAALSDHYAHICAEDAAVQLPNIPALVVTKVDQDDSDKAREIALSAAGSGAARVYGASQWSDKLISGGYDAVTADDAAKIRNLARTGNQDGGTKITDAAVRRGVKAAGDRAGIVTLTYAAGAIKAAYIYTCVYPGNRVLVLPLGRPD